MKMESIDTATERAVEDPQPQLGPAGFETLRDLARDIDTLRELVADIACLANDHSSKKLRRLTRELDELVPTVTMIGQVKAGKTSLVNAMIGRPDYLPADVNPWTSVVTSLFLNTPQPEGAPAAKFQLFSTDEWDNLVENGGRLGELSRRANADDELGKVQAQIAEMREKTRRRLGRKFELLLGQTHEFDNVTEELIQSYVCMGDEPGMDDDGPEPSQGRFADLTKSAELFMKVKDLPTPLCVRDTPGVNDTFLMREQITIKALRSSRLCAVVLSAHQALTTTDMAMIRMIANVKARDLVIFVNRIDELADPANQVPEIRASIMDTLAKHNAPTDVRIVFGSAYWANLAVSGTMEEIEPDSADALMNWGAAADVDMPMDEAPEAMAWRLSGVPDLFTVLGQAIATGEAAEKMDSVRREALNIVSGLAVSSSVVTAKLNGTEARVAPREDIEHKLNLIEDKAMGVLQDRLTALERDFSERVDRSRKRFLDRAVEVLLQHLEEGGEKTWTYSADGLRVLLRSSFTVLTRNYKKQCSEVYEAVAAEMEGLYRDAFDVTTEGFSIAAPMVPAVPAPVTLGTTIALDLQTSWWKGFWQRRKGHRAQAENYYRLIAAETAPLVEQLTEGHVEEIRRNAVRELEKFLDTQGSQLLDVSAQSEVSEEDIRSLFGVDQMEEMDDLLALFIEDLEQLSTSEEINVSRRRPRFAQTPHRSYG